MAWDNIWDKIFQKQEWGKYPPEELVRFIARNFYKVHDRKKIKILDIGCGTGAATWFIAREGFFVHGIDGSKTGIEKARKRFEEENLNAEFKIGDINQINYPDNYFDSVVDIAAIQHNDIEDIKNILSEIYRVLKQDGLLFSMMVGNETKCDRRYYEDRGFVHFFTQEEIRDILRNFDIVSLERSERTENNQEHKIVHWIVTARKINR